MYERDRIDRTRRVVLQSTANRGLLHGKSNGPIREDFRNRDEGASRNQWLCSYNPMQVALV